MRLFVGVWPPPEVCRLLAELPRPRLDGIAWTAPDRWHVTLLFLGEVASADVATVEAALVDAAARVAAPPEAVLGPAVAVLGRNVLCVPVAGLDPAAAAVRAAMGERGAVALRPGGEDYRGHLTLARARGRRHMPHRLAGAAVEARWRVDGLCLVASRVEATGARYTTLAVATVPS